LQSENIELEGLSPSDREILTQLRRQTSTNSHTEKMLLEVAPHDPLATRFLLDTKHRTFADVSDGEIATWMQQEWNREPNAAHARKAKRLRDLIRAATDVEICAHPESRGLLGTLGIPASLEEAKRRYREVANGGRD